jgi:hypothetical protein
VQDSGTEMAHAVRDTVTAAEVWMPW